MEVILTFHTNLSTCIIKTSSLKQEIVALYIFLCSLFRGTEAYAHYGQDNLSVMAPSLAGPSSHAGLGPTAPSKRPRLAERADLTQPLHIDVEAKRVSCNCQVNGLLVCSLPFLLPLLQKH